jgi:zinc transport system substrate-binding protein
MKIFPIYIMMLSLIFSCSGPVKNDAAVVATNSWTAAFAQAAGAKNIVVLAPYEMVHPTEYELRAADIPLIVHAKVIIYAGYETMVKRIESGMDLKKDVLVRIETDYSMATIEKSVMEIAQRLGTEKIALQNLDTIRRLITESRAQFDRTGLNSTPVLVNFFQQSIVREMGFEAAAVFGPGSLEAADIDRLAKLRSGMIVDNMHNPVGKPLMNIQPGVVYRQLLNFPGSNQTTDLLDVIRYNIRQLNPSTE